MLIGESRAGQLSVWAGRIISALAGLPLLVSAGFKVSGNPQIAQGFAHLGLPISMLVLLAVLEAVSAILYLIPMTSVVGAILVTGYMGGAIVTHLRVGESVGVQVLIPILAWLGLYLREPRVRALIPLKQTGRR